jgi:hypothetical protein
MVCSLYELKSAGASIRSSLAQILQDIGYTSTKADPNVWLRKAAKDNRFEYYKMLFIYVDDILALSHCTKDAIHQITKFYRAKEGSVKPPEIYIGANISKMQLPNGREVWTTSPKACVKNSLLVVKRLFSKDGDGYILKSNVKNLSLQATNQKLMSRRNLIKR